MGIFDRFRHHKDDAGGSGTALKDRAAGLKDNAAGMMSNFGGQAGQGLDKAGQVIDEKTGGKYSDQINTGVGRAKDMFGHKTEQPSGAAGEAGSDAPHPDPGAQAGGGEQPPQS